MLKQSIVFLFICAALMAGCAPVASAPTPAKKSGTFRVAFPTNADTADVPSLMAHELLEAQGYTVQQNFFDAPEVAVAALASGEMDIGNGSTRTHWAATEKGADIVMLMEQAANVWSLVGIPELKACKDLDGKRIGVNSAGSISNALLQAYVKQNCPEITPETLFVSGSDNRAVALQAGELDGTLLEIADVVQLEQAAPGKYPLLIDYAKALPQLKTNGIYTSRAFAAKNPEMVRDYIKAVLAIHRNIRENPAMLYDALQKYLKLDAATSKTIGDAYLARNIWNVNGSLSPEDVAYSLDFFVGMGSVPAGLDAAKLTDVSYLDAVLKEIGTK